MSVCLSWRMLLQLRWNTGFCNSELWRKYEWILVSGGWGEDQLWPDRGGDNPGRERALPLPVDAGVEGLGALVRGCTWEPVEVADLSDEISICDKCNASPAIAWIEYNFRAKCCRQWSSKYVWGPRSAGWGVGWQGASHFQLGRGGWHCWTLLLNAAQNVLPSLSYREGKELNDK